ncbi:MAG TPA: hypothetical protein VGM33_05920 [Baekduia sp.]
MLIARYVAENPAPGQSRVALDLQSWSDALVLDGRERLEALGESPLRLAEPPGPEPDPPDRPDRPTAG